MSRKKISVTTIKKLYAKSGNQCAFPVCNQELYTDNNTENHSNICHIEAAKEGGQRYNQKSDNDYRRSLSNLILLCPTHHKTTDDENQYPVEKLQQMKENHEREVRQKIMSDNPSIILDAVNALSEVDWDNQDYEKDQKYFSIEEKLNHNSIKRWKPIIAEYKVYQAKIDSIYSQLEQSGESFKKLKLLCMIKNIYLYTLGEYDPNNSQKKRLKIVQENADDILDKIQEKLSQKSGSIGDNAFIAMPVIMVDAFMRCKILEKPN